MGAEHGHRLIVLDQLVDQIARGAGRETFRRHDRAIMPLAPTHFLQRLVGAFLLDVQDLVEGPRRALIGLDHERAERNRLAAVRMIDRAARLPVHAFDLAVLALVIGDDGSEVADLQLPVQFLHYDRPERIENLTRVEAIFAVCR